MNAKRFPPNDPKEWFNRAKSNLLQACSKPEGVYFEDLCFNAQQAAEKAIKSVLIHKEIHFPYIHDLTKLLSLLEQRGEGIPKPIKHAARLTRYAVVTRYPGFSEPISPHEYKEAIIIAKAVIRWAETVIQGQTTLFAAPSRMRKKRTKS